jgi:aspartate aminotransferase-like enzyme
VTAYSEGAGDEPLLLMTPGPTRVPERVLRAGARPMIHHRTPEFSRELAVALELLRPMFGTAETPLPIHTTGRGALEASICNLFSPGDEIAVCCNGKFGEMWARLAESYGVVVRRVATRWELGIDASELEAALDDYPRVRAIALAFGDSSTGVANDIETVARIGRSLEKLVLVDGVSSIGGMRFAFDEWGVDVAVTASQKCLMSAPGLSWAALSDRAWSACESARLPRSYWDFAAVKRAVGKARPETPGTPPVAIVLQVAEALRAIHEEGLDAVYARHASLARRTREGIHELGLSLQCPELPRLSATMTAIALPAGIEPRALRERIKARGILTAGGLGPFEPTGFRVGHMGDIRMADVERTLDALRHSLDEVRANADGAPAHESRSERAVAS